MFNSEGEDGGASGSGEREFGTGGRRGSIGFGSKFDFGADLDAAGGDRKAVGGFARSLAGLFETTSQSVGSVGELHVYGLPLDYYGTLPARIDAVTVAKLQSCFCSRRTARNA